MLLTELNISGFFQDLVDRYTHYAAAYPPFIRLALVSIFIAVILTIVLYIYILTSRLLDKSVTRRNNHFRKKVEELIIQHIILNTNLQEGQEGNIRLPEEEFRTLGIRRRWARQLMIDEIIYYHKNFSGKASMALRRLFIQLGLDKTAYRKLNSAKWNKKVQGLHELAELQLFVPDVKMLELTNSRNRILRMEARAAYIQLSKNDPFKFFDSIHEPMLEWEQLYLFEVITKTRNLVIPSFSRWLNYSSNPWLIIFCLKLIEHYNQFNTIPSVMKLLDHADPKVRAAAINALGKLEATEAEDKLAVMYIDQPVFCQVEILKAFGRIRSSRQLPFLQEEFLRSQDYEIRKNAARSIIEHGNQAKEMIADLLTHASDDRKKTMKHCMDPLIKY